MAKAQKNFLSGALVLTLSVVAVKIIGAIYKIPLANLLGPVGMNYYNDAYQIFSMLFVLSTVGVPVAIAKMVSESVAHNRLTEPKKILKISTGMFAALGFILMILLIALAPALSGLLASDRVNTCFYLIAPAIFLVGISSTIKGYFQGYKCMTPSAIFQVLEAGFKLVGIAIVGYMILGQGIKDPLILACGGILGVSFGSFAATIYMLITIIREKEFGKDTEGSLPSRSGGAIAKNILTLAIPISLSNAVLSLSTTIDMVLVKRSLRLFGLTTEEILHTYGAYTGSTSSLFNLTPTLTATIGIAVLPFITSAFAAGKREEAFRNIRSSAKVLALIAMPAALGMSTLSEPIVKLLYVDSFHSIGSPSLMILAPSIFFVCFSTLTNTYLHSIGKVFASLISMGVGAIAKIAVNLLLVPKIGILGAPISTVVCYGLIVTLNLIFIAYYMKFRFPLSVFIKPLCSSILCCAAAYGSWWGLCAMGLSATLALFPAILVAVMVYAICLLLFKAIAKEDLVFIPKGEKIGRILERKGWLHE